MTPSTSIRAEQTVGSNLGRMVAIDAGLIKGDVYIERISQVQVVTLTREGREQSAERLIGIDACPYVSLYPYTPTDEALFKGRDREIDRIVETLHAQSVLVVYGHASVGKTSLLSAGVIPALAREGAFAIRIQDYEEPEKTIVEGLSSSSETFAFELPRQSRLPELLKEIIEKVRGTLVLALDQFELLFEPRIGDEQRNQFIASLAEAVRTIDPRYLRVIIAIRSEYFERLGEIEKQVPFLLNRPFELLPLTREQAVKAITEPLYVGKPESQTAYDGNLVEELLVPDLEALTENKTDSIQPQQLQLVCDILFRHAEKRGQVRMITANVYLRELKGADGILASFMRTMMQTRIREDQLDRALQLLAIMASPRASRWMKGNEFELRDITDVEIERTLDRLVEAKLLVGSSFSGDGKSYSLVSQLISRELRLLSGSGTQVEEKYNAEAELERVWHTWLSLEHFASPEQIRYLARSGGHLDPRAVKTLLMLRSAIEADEETNTWLMRLRGTVTRAYGEGRYLIEQLESGRAAPEDQRIGRAMAMNAKRLLGFTDNQLSSGSTEEAANHESGSASPGPVARQAVSAGSSTVRQTCAVALSSAGSAFAITQVEEALGKVSSARRRRALRSELRGALADADPEVAEKNSKLPFQQRLFIWAWRARRCVARDRRRLGWLTLGGAVGAGLGVGLLRAILAVKGNLSAGQEFGIYFFFAGTLGGALSYGLALSEPLQLVHRNEANPKRWRATLTSITLGTVFFGLAHLSLAILNGLRMSVGRSYYIILMGFILGLGLSVSLSIPIPDAGGWRSRIFAWAVRLLIASAAFILVSELFILVRMITGSDVLETLITRGVGHWEGILLTLRPSRAPWWFRLLGGYSSSPHVLATVYSALTSVFMATGLTLGLRQSEKSLRKRKQ